MSFENWCAHIKVIRWEMEDWPMGKPAWVDHFLFVDPVEMGKVQHATPSWMFCPVCGKGRP